MLVLTTFGAPAEIPTVFSRNLSKVLTFIIAAITGLILETDRSSLIRFSKSPRPSLGSCTDGLTFDKDGVTSDTACLTSALGRIDGCPGVIIWKVKISRIDLKKMCQVIATWHEIKLICDLMPQNEI